MVYELEILGSELITKRLELSPNKPDFYETLRDLFEKENIRIRITDHGKVNIISNIADKENDEQIDVWGSTFESGFKPQTFKQRLKFPEDAKDDIHKIIDDQELML